MKKTILSVILFVCCVAAGAQKDSSVILSEMKDIEDEILVAGTEMYIDTILADQARKDKQLLKKMQENTVTHHINTLFGFGANGLAYKPIGGVYKLSYGGDFRLQYLLMANKNWGFSIGAQISAYQSAAIYNYSYHQNNLVHADNGLTYNRKITFRDWKEKQLLLQVELPVMFQYRRPMKEDNICLLVGAGVSFGFPVYNTYKTTEGDYTLTGYFPSTNVEYSDLVNHGLTSTKYGPNGVSNITKYNVGAVLDLGFTFKMSEASDFYLGVYGGYYFMNSITDTPQDLLQTPANGDKYVGTFCSDRVSHVNPFNAGLRLGFMFRADKGQKRLDEMKKRMEEARKNLEELERLKAKHAQDSIDAASKLRQAGEEEEAVRETLAKEAAEKAMLDAEFAKLRAEHDSLLKKKNEMKERKRIAAHINSIAHFDTAQDFPYMDDDARDALRRLAELMNENANVYVIVYGHADNTGDHDKNIIYGQRRAEALKKILINHGADPARVISVSRGDEDPVADNETPEGRALNRRAEVDIQER